MDSQAIYVGDQVYHADNFRTIIGTVKRIYRCEPDEDLYCVIDATGAAHLITSNYLKKMTHQGDAKEE